MIDREKIEEIINSKVADSEVFVVDITIKPGNLIQVYLDEPGGISLDTCVEYSRLIESSLDRDAEDFSLQVSSPGLDQPFRVMQQYDKAIGQSIQVLKNDGSKYIGLLKSADKTEIQLETELKVKVPGTKKKQIELQTVAIDFKDIKTAKVNLVF